MESALYGIYALVVFVSEILLVRFLIRQQLVRKYRTPALSMKYSLYNETFLKNISLVYGNEDELLCSELDIYITELVNTWQIHVK